MTVMTILCCGTAYNRENKDEIIAELTTLVSGTEARYDSNSTRDNIKGDFIINEGPGSYSETPDINTPGQANPFYNLPKSRINEIIEQDWRRAEKSIIGDRSTITTTESEKRKTFHAHFFGNAYPENNVQSGLLFGSGWDDNVLRTIAIICNLSSIPTTINLAGWSRGAVTCIKIANAIFEIFENNIEINLILLDPVYGISPSYEEKDSRLPPNVKNAVIFLATDEKKPGFQPQDKDVITYTQNTKVDFLTIYGTHSALVTKMPAPCDSAWRITWSYTIDFLKKHGTTFKPHALQYVLSTHQYCDQYAAMMYNKDNYNNLDSMPATRTLKGKLDKYTIMHKYFVNNHHFECFYTSYPILYNFIFTYQGQLNSIIVNTFKHLNNSIISWLGACKLISRTSLKTPNGRTVISDAIIPTHLSNVFYDPTLTSRDYKISINKYD
ncbi:hypothetical protein PSCICE_15850 [Pseudomonas cichorii]|nr:DUF5621 domain-containing protein [Pseudomonas cichorii]GFM50318.1 hypothetical protein PSCICE_15850 [Pseudomonas cichorii]